MVETGCFPYLSGKRIVVSRWSHVVTSASNSGAFWVLTLIGNTMTLSFFLSEKYHLINKYVKTRWQYYVNTYWQSLVQIWINDQVCLSATNPLSFLLVQAIYCVTVGRSRTRPWLICSWSINSIHVAWNINYAGQSMKNGDWNTNEYTITVLYTGNKQMVKLWKYFADFNFRGSWLTAK